MSTTTVVSPTAMMRQPGAQVQWIISRGEDLTWFIGSAFGGYPAIALMWVGFPVLPIQFLWFFGLDNPHVLATAARTDFDKAERKKLGWRLWMPVPLLLAGPVMVLLGKGPIPFGIFHGLQYYPLLGFHNHNLYNVPEARERKGLAAVLAKDVSRYLAVALSLNLVLAFLLQVLFPHQAVSAAIWGIAFIHYILDAKIWHVRQDKELAVALGMGSGQES